MWMFNQFFENLIYFRLREVRNVLVFSVNMPPKRMVLGISRLAVTYFTCNPEIRFVGMYKSNPVNQFLKCKGSLGEF